MPVRFKHWNVRRSVYCNYVCVCVCVACNVYCKFPVLDSCTLYFGLNYELIYQPDAIEYLFVYFQLHMFRAYTPIVRSNGC